MAKVYIETYGCTLNQADSDIMAALLSERHKLVKSENCCDVIILNTCTVKGATENKIFERIRKFVTENRKFVVAGCLTANYAKIRKFAPFAPVVGTSSLRRINDAVQDAISGVVTYYNTNEKKDALPKLPTSPICRIPINDGCVSSCHFCQTRLARPYLLSYSPKTILKWINESIVAGAKEIQLTSQDSGAYGLDIRTDLVALLNAIIADNGQNTQNAEFLIRLGMINPEHAKRMLPALIRALSHKKFYKFLHIPVQTGSEKVCKEMNRNHTVADFVDILRHLRKDLPEVTIATDVIVGYPTETEDDFRQTLKLLQNTKPEIVNLSKFSPRPGTKAKELKQLSNNEIKKRSEEASVLIKNITAEARQRYIGRTLRVLITEKGKDFKGRAINYQQVVVKGFGGKLGEFAEVEIYDANHGSLFGELSK